MARWMVIWVLGAALSAQEKSTPGPVWTDARALTVEGQGWREVDAPFDRLPGKAKDRVRPAVWGLSRCAAGICVRFRTDATSLHVRWTLTSENLAMAHMPATGVSGLDLYVMTKAGSWRWLATAQPGQVTNQRRLFGGLAKETRTYLLYLPLYNGVRSVELGVAQGTRLEPAPRLMKGLKPVVFYGTSITQGACASRPGMAHVAILGRRLGVPVINLGFSGNGKMESELAELLAEIDAAAYVIDCLPNMNGKLVTARAVPFVEALRKRRPTVPIVLVEDRTYQDAHLALARRRHNDANRRALRAAYAQLLAKEVPGLHYLKGEALLGKDGEGTVDGSHPTDLGFVRQADAFQPLLRSFLWR